MKWNNYVLTVYVTLGSVWIRRRYEWNDKDRVSVSVGAHSCLILDIATPGVHQSFDQIFLASIWPDFWLDILTGVFWRGT